MKKTLIMTLIIAMVLSVASIVNAAGSMAPSAKKVEVGDKVTVTVNFGKAMATTDFKLTYDKTLLEYVSDTAENRNQESDGTRFVTYSNDTKSVTVTFKALKSGTANIGFVANEFTNTDLDVEEVTVGNTSVVINKKAETPAKDKTPSDESKAPTRLPQTGLNVAGYVAVAGLVVLAIAGVQFVNKKYQK